MGNLFRNSTHTYVYALYTQPNILYTQKLITLPLKSTTLNARRAHQKQIRRDSCASTFVQKRHQIHTPFVFKLISFNKLVTGFVNIPVRTNIRPHTSEMDRVPVQPKSYPTNLLQKDWTKRAIYERCGQAFVDKVHDMEVKDDDVWIVTLPKCGTTWMQELLWLVMNDFDFEAARNEHLEVRTPFLE